MNRVDPEFIRIQQELESGLNPYVVAKRLNVPLQMVEEVEAELYDDLFGETE